uniref:Protein dimmed-like n=1 Tax=Saccoglossus kowalevskii TaxID=10224 RepID=A0ABM0GWD6_SACKO|nr:PREDICTED: protein dimmed-like [Saccoglossus kowalevskii]
MENKFSVRSLAADCNGDSYALSSSCSFSGLNQCRRPCLSACKEDSFQLSKSSIKLSCRRRRKPKIPRRKDLNSPDSLIRRLKANSQERMRMHRLNTALDELRKVIPRQLCDRRLSKIKTLRLAISYISALADMVNGNDGSSSFRECARVVEDWSDKSQEESDDSGDSCLDMFIDIPKTTR